VVLDGVEPGHTHRSRRSRGSRRVPHGPAREVDAVRKDPHPARGNALRLAGYPRGILGDGDHGVAQEGRDAVREHEPRDAREVPAVLGVHDDGNARELRGQRPEEVRCGIVRVDDVGAQRAEGGGEAPQELPAILRLQREHGDAEGLEARREPAPAVEADDGVVEGGLVGEPDEVQDDHLEPAHLEREDDVDDLDARRSGGGSFFDGHPRGAPSRISRSRVRSSDVADRATRGAIAT
jgi:hypothetical protein